MKVLECHKFVILSVGSNWPFFLVTTKKLLVKQSTYFCRFNTLIKKVVSKFTSFCHALKQFHAH